MIDRIPIDAVGIQERVSRICTRSIKRESKLQALELALRMMDLTTLRVAILMEKFVNYAIRRCVPIPNYLIYHQ